MKDHGAGVDVIISDLDKNPHCTHGPTVLFERFHENGRSCRYYACSACRDRKDCSFFHEAHLKFSEAKQEVWQTLRKEAAPKFSHSNCYSRLKKIKNLPALQRSFCVDCSEFWTGKKGGHKSCEVRSALFDAQLRQPSLILKPKENAKVEAQYMFTSNSIEIITGMLEQLNAEKVLCIGTPRIFEAIINSPEKKMSSLLMDIDERYRLFFSTTEFVRYNMFNHHFFDGKETKRQVYRKFITGDEKLVIVTDPPFGGRLELLGQNLKTIQKEWREANKLSEDKELSVLFIFPYFNESQVSEQLPTFKMLDYQVDYDNHPLYSSGPKGMICGSAVRVYVNDRPSLFPLPENKGYRMCEPCDRWVRSNNFHCKKCSGCMSKDGSTYKHCEECKKCVKPLWNHCSKCQKCYPQNHSCDNEESPKSFLCHVCGKEGHRRADCPNRKRSLDLSETRGKNKKRRIENKNEKSVSSPVEVSSKKDKRKQKKSNMNSNKSGVLGSKITTTAVIGKKKKMNANSPKNQKNSNGMTKKNNKQSKKQALKENLTQKTDNNKNKAKDNEKNSNGISKKSNKKTVFASKKQALKENNLQIKNTKKNKKGKNKT